MPTADASGVIANGPNPRPATMGHEPVDELRGLILTELRTAVGLLPSSLRHIAEYQFGWRDENARPTRGSGGKMVRPVLTLMCARAAGGQPKDMLPAAVSVELIHNFSLVHDDIMDGDATRRHRAAVWSAFGTASALLLGDALLAQAFKITGTLRKEQAVAVSDALLEMLEGQASDLALEKESTATLAEGLTMAADKTGALLRCACRIGALGAGADSVRAAAFGEFGAHLGLAFQLTDDLLSIWGDPGTTGKPAHNDLRTRKKSLPVLAALASRSPAARQLAHYYKGGADLPLGPEAYVELASLIEQAGGRAWAERHGREAHTQAVAALERAQPDPGAAADLLALADALAHRKH